jgi:23S rRNA pseudouridine1911/1915/1917 synthase
MEVKKQSNNTMFNNNVEISSMIKSSVEMDEYNLCATAEWENHRLDKTLADYFDNFSRSYLKKLFDDEKILVNGKVVKPSYKIKAFDSIDIYVPDNSEPDIVPENIPLDIVYEDDDIIIVNKPKGVVVHPAPGHFSGTLVNGLMYHFKDSLSGINGELRPGIVHRIDMDTTGVLVVCKNDNAHRVLSEKLQNHDITRKYYAIVHGNITQDSGTVDKPIGRSTKDRKKMAVNERNGRRAVTHYKVLKRLSSSFGSFTFVECQLETGRTHQIRVHMASIGHPLLGDEVYGPRKCPFKLQGQTLHAGVLGFIHPVSGEYMEFSSPLPEYFTELLKRLGD